MASKSAEAGRNGNRSTRVLDVSALESWLWRAACVIRGQVDAPKFKDYILPLVFIKRLSDVFDDEFERIVEDFGDRDFALSILRDDHRMVRFYVPETARWSAIKQRAKLGLGQYLTDVVRDIVKSNESLHGVIDAVDFNATTAGQRIIGDDQLSDLIGVLSEYRLGLVDVEPDVLGRAYEYLLRKFAEGQGQSAGEFYTPREVAEMMARILDPQPGMSAYDPTVGSGGLLVKLHQRMLRQHGVPTNGHFVLPSDRQPLLLYGQEINPTTYAMAKMNMVLHGIEEDSRIAIGDTMRRPGHTNADGSLATFDLVMANPMWNQKFPDATYEHDAFDRFAYGNPPASSADWGWLQHMLASLKPRGRMAVVLDTGAVSRGSGNSGANRERDVRRAFIEGTLLVPGDLIEAVILLPENLFYNTTAPGGVIVINRAKRHPGEILLINASRLFVKERPKNVLPLEHAQQIADLYHAWRTEDGLSAIITTADAAQNDYNLSPSRYVSNGSDADVISVEDAVMMLTDAESELAKTNDALRRIFSALHLTQ